MRPRATLLLRRLLLGVVALVAVSVFWTLRRPSAPTESDPSEAAEGTTIKDLAFDVFEEGERKVELKARAMTGEEDGLQRFEGVEVTFPFEAQGKPSTATITSDECLYDGEREYARFRGNVHVVTSDGFDLRTESLDYIGDEGRVVAEAPVQFSQGATSGSASGAEYREQGDRLELNENVHLRFEDGEGGPPTEIDAARARGSRETRLINFGGGVEVRQGQRVLRSKRLQVILNAELEGIERIAAIEDVDLRIRGSGELPGAELPGGGTRRLRCRRLNVGLRAGGILKHAVASNNASLVLLPGPGDPPERRELEARQIRFVFDEEGRLSAVTARDWGGAGKKGSGIVTLLSRPVGEAKSAGRRVECLTFEAELDPVSGTLKTADFAGRVEFTEPGRKGWAEHAVYDESAKLLQMTGGGPRIRDEADGSELQAERIDLSTATRSVVAVDSVRHEIRGRETANEGRMLGGSEPTILVCQRFEYDSAKKTAIYRENALLRAGRDEVRAPLIVLEDPGPGQRRLHATGGVASFLHPRRAPGTEGEEEKEPAPVETRSQEMVYEETAGRVVYTGEVQIRQGDILTLSPEAVVTLTDERDGVVHIVAGEPVVVRQGERRAEGRTGTYTPANETMVLEGDDVVLQDVDRQIRGRILTFKVGEDRIRVDGQEEARTEAIFRKSELAQP